MIRVMLMAGALLVIAQLHRASGAVLASELNRSFGLDAASIGVVMGAMFMASAVVQVPVGLAFDRHGTRRTVSVLTLFALAGTVVLVVATSAPGLTFGRFLIGIGLGGTITAIFLLAMRWAPPERFTTVAATVIASGSAIGGLLATVPLALALTRYGWAACFTVIGLATGVVNLLFLVIVRDAPAVERQARGDGQSLAEIVGGLRRLLGDRHFRRVLAMAFCTIAPFATIIGLWAGPYLQDVHGLSPAEASYALLGLIVSANLGTLVYGPLDRRLGNRRGLVLGGALATMLIALALALWPRPALAQAVLLMVMLALTTPFYVVLAAQCRDLVPPASVGRAITSVNLCALAGASAMQWLSGVLIRATAEPGGLGSALGYRLVFGLIALLLLLAVLVYRRTPGEA